MSHIFIVFIPAGYFLFCCQWIFFQPAVKYMSLSHYFCFCFFQITSFLSHSAQFGADQPDTCFENQVSAAYLCLSSLYFPVFSVYVTLKTLPFQVQMVPDTHERKKSQGLIITSSFYRNILLFLLFRH